MYEVLLRLSRLRAFMTLTVQITHRVVTSVHFPTAVKTNPRRFWIRSNLA